MGIRIKFAKMMDDLKEDLLDTAAIIKEKFKKLGKAGWLLVIFPMALWPLFYMMLAFGLIKIIISGLGVAYFLRIFYKQFFD